MQERKAKKPAGMSAVFLAAMLCLASGNIARADQEVLTFGVVPQQAASTLARIWSPIFAHLSEKTGYQIVFKTAPNIPEFEARLAAGQYDLAYMNPYHYIVFGDAPGYLAFAKQQDKKIKGIIVARTGSAITAINDLDGLEMAFPSPLAFAASILPRAFLRSQGINISPKYVSSHDSVYRNVAAGRLPAGGGIIRTLKTTDENVRNELSIVWESPGYTPHAFAAHPRLSETTRLRVRDAMIAMSTEPEGAALLKSIKFAGIEGVAPGDWDDIRALNIGSLDEVQSAAADRE